MASLITLIVGVMVIVAMDVWMARQERMAKKAGVRTQSWFARRSIARNIRWNIERRPVPLLHLTKEQWQSHGDAFADYCAGMGKYHRQAWKSNGRGMAAWLESEGLPPTPKTIVPEYNSKGHFIRWLNTAEEEIRYAGTA